MIDRRYPGIHRQRRYQALGKVLTEMKPEEVCQEVIAFGLRGREAEAFLPDKNGSLPGSPGRQEVCDP